MTDPTPKLRLVLQTNAAFSAAGGLLAVAAASFVSDKGGIGHVALTRLVGVGLLIFAVDVFRTSRLSAPKLLQGALLISIADFTWVITSLVVIAFVDLTTAGVIVGLVQTAAVLDFGVTQYWLRSKAVSSGATAPVAV
jgi:hypothetical protein